MKVQLNLYASLRSYLPDYLSKQDPTMDVEEGKTVGQLIEDLNIPQDAPKILFVNGIHAKRDQVLKDGDRLALFPPIAGG